MTEDGRKESEQYLYHVPDFKVKRNVLAPSNTVHTRNSKSCMIGTEANSVTQESEDGDKFTRSYKTKALGATMDEELMKNSFALQASEAREVGEDKNGDVTMKIVDNHKGTKILTSKRETIKIKSEIISHADSLFQEILKNDNISSKDILNSLSLDKNRDSVFRAGEGTGRSGSFFFFSYDRKFIIKTLKGNERECLIDMLEDFVKHLKMMNGNTLLAKIYGLYTIKTNVFDPLDIILMQNTSMLQDPSNDRLLFDLKGSISNRKSKLGKKNK